MDGLSNYDKLIQKLDTFSRKYYLNQIIRGILYSVAIILVLFLLVNLMEYKFYFDKGVRKVLFYSFIGISILSIVFLVGLPVLHYFRLGRVISREAAARIIGEHFSEVKDKLLNILQLKNQAKGSQSDDLILASINQKSEDIKLVPFKKAIDLSKNKKYLKYTIPPLLLLLIILFAAPSVLKESSMRLIKNDVDFRKPAAFSFDLENKELRTVQDNDFPITVFVEGDVLPNEVYIDVDDYQYRMKKIDPHKFTYRLVNVQKDIKFNFFSGKVYSPEYKLTVLKKPNIVGFEVNLDYPAYTGRKDETVKNIGDLVVPVGSRLNWVFNTNNTDDIAIKYANEKEKVVAKSLTQDSYTFSKRILKKENYKIFVSNKYLPNADSIGYVINVIPDLYPTINVKSFPDSTQTGLLYFAGEAADDYGLLSLSFHYTIKDEKGTVKVVNAVQLKKPVNKQVQFEYDVSFDDFNLEPGDEVSYYFEVFDNDGINGSKSARTNLMVYTKPSIGELEEKIDKNDEKIKDNLKKTLEESKKIKKDLKKMREKVLQKKELDWQDKKELEKLLERQKELEKQIEEAKKSYEENMKNQEEISKSDEKIMEKQEKLQELFEEVMDENLKKLMDEIEELMQELEKDQLLDKMEDMELSDDEVEKELDRLMELFKQLELEKDMKETIEKLEELAEKQEELSEETAKDEKNKEELSKEQEEINKEFEDIQKKMDEMEKKNEELQNKKDLGDHEEEMEDIEEQLEDSKEKIDQGENKPASKSQKQAASKMKEMANSMSQAMQAQEMEQMEEDMKALRQLLENIVTLSFEQEDLMLEVDNSIINTPHYVELTERQFQIKDDFVMIEDSLVALSSRMMQIESYVMEKVGEVKRHMRKGIDFLEDRKKSKGAEQEQHVMKNLNDLALMLSETMNQLQQQMSGMMSGNQMCNKPGGQGKDGNVPMDKISQGQKGLKEQLQKMKDGMKNGDGGSSKEFAKAAAKQAALRNALRAKQKKLQEQGKGAKELQDIIDGMNKTETDLVNKRLTNEMMKRQEEILSRLLEAEKAERKRELDKKRKAETADNIKRQVPPSMKEYIKKREAEVELYNSVSPALRPYYKILVETYFNKLKEK